MSGNYINTLSRLTQHTESNAISMMLVLCTCDSSTYSVLINLFIYFLTVNMNKEAQLSQRGRAMLRVLKILPSHSISFKFISKLHRREVCVDGLTSYPLYA